MGLFGFGKKATPVKDVKASAVPVSPNSFLAFALGVEGEYVTAAKAAEFYQRTSAVASAVDMIAEKIEQIVPVIKNIEDGKFVGAHEILDFLQQPNGMETYQTFIGDVARNYLLKHDAIIVAVGNIRSAPIEIWSRPFHAVSVMQAEDDYPANYSVLTGPVVGDFSRTVFPGNKTRFVDGSLKELHHIKGYSSRASKVESDSPLQAAANEAKQIIKGKLHNLAVLQNGGRLSLLIAFDDHDEITDDEHKARVKMINEQYGGPQNVGKIAVVSNANVSEIKEFGTSNKDMDYVNLETSAELAIYKRYQIPLPLVTLSASSYNNIEQSIEMLYDNAVLPNIDVLFSNLSKFLMPRFGLDPRKFELTYNPESISALKSRAIKEVKERRDIGVETINELRSLLPGREPLENGDTLYQPANLVPVGDDLFTDDNNAT